jgi:hypothetical protein
MSDAADDIQDWTPQKVFDALCVDFETAWNAVAAVPMAPNQGRGKFLFANQAMILFEWACQLCAGDSTGAALVALGRELHTLRPTYFTSLPITLDVTAAGNIALPRESGVPDSHTRPLLWLLFDLIRNGLAHQYQQLVLRLDDGPVYVSRDRLPQPRANRATCAWL